MEHVREYESQKYPVIVLISLSILAYFIFRFLSVHFLFTWTGTGSSKRMWQVETVIKYYPESLSFIV